MLIIVCSCVSAKKSKVSEAGPVQRDSAESGFSVLQIGPVAFDSFYDPIIPGSAHTEPPPRGRAERRGIDRETVKRRLRILLQDFKEQLNLSGMVVDRNRLDSGFSDTGSDPIEFGIGISAFDECGGEAEDTAQTFFVKNV